MYNILLFTGVLVLVFVCVLAMLFILMQRPNANAGMGSALGGAATESVFGGETTSVLTKSTSVLITVFFLLCIGLYFAFVARGTHQKDSAANLSIEQAEQKTAAESSLYTDENGNPLTVETTLPAEETASVPAEQPPAAPAEPVPAPEEQAPAAPEEQPASAPAGDPAQ